MLNIIINDNKPIRVQVEAANLEKLEVCNHILQKVANAIKDTTPQSEKPYALFLTSVCGAKLQCVKAVKESLNLGIKEAKDLTDIAATGESVLLTKSHDVEALYSIKRQIENTGSICKLVQE